MVFSACEAKMLQQTCFRQGGLGKHDPVEEKSYELDSKIFLALIPNLSGSVLSHHLLPCIQKIPQKNSSVAKPQYSKCVSSHVGHKMKIFSMKNLIAFNK